MNNATVRISKFNGLNERYELIWQGTVPDEEARNVEQFLSESIKVMCFYKYDFFYSNGINVVKYSSWSDAIGYVRATDWRKESPVTLTPLP